MKAFPMVFAMLISIPVLAAAPSTAPKAHDMAVTGSLGFTAPFDNAFDGVEFAMTSSFEWYMTPRISWRAMLGFTTFTANRPGDPKVDAAFMNANFVYNWDLGRIHPFATAGGGLYKKHGSSGLPSDFDETNLGMNTGGGVDWLLGPQWGLKFEGAMHAVTGQGPSTFFLGTAGVIFWF